MGSSIPMNKCIKKTIFYRILSIVTMLPIVYIFNNGNILGAFETTFFVEVVIHSAIYYGIERREEKKEREELIRKYCSNATK